MLLTAGLALVGTAKNLNSIGRLQVERRTDSIVFRTPGSRRGYP